VLEMTISIDGEVLPPFQIIRRFDFSRCIALTMYLDIVYIQVHSKSYVSRKTKTSNNLEQREYILYARGFNQNNKVMLLAYDDSHESLILRVRCACWGSKEQKLRYSGDWNRECVA